MKGSVMREPSRSLKEQFSRSSEAWKEQSDQPFGSGQRGDWWGFPFFSLSASRYFGEKQTLCLYWPLATVIITGRCASFRRLPRRRQAKSGVPRRITRRNHIGPAFQRRRNSARLGSSFGNILRFGFGLKNMVCHIFWPKAKQSALRKEAAGARARNAVEDLNGGHRRAALGGDRLSPQTALLPEGRPWARNASGLG
jgi:hypothetical protein